MLLKGYNDLCKKVVVPGFLYIQMENFHLTGKNITSFGYFEYFYKNVLDTKKSHADSATFDVNNPSQWVQKEIFDELDRNPRKPFMIYALPYKNIYLHIFITLGPFFDETLETTDLFAIDFQGYILDEPYAEEFADKICNKLFGGQVDKTAFLEFIKETFPENYAKKK